MNKILIAVVALSATLNIANAGNKDRSGQAAASELLVNPWASTGGMWGMNGASIRGVEAMKLNVAGLARVKTLELGAAHTIYMTNTDVRINNISLGYALNKRSKLGVNLMNVDYGSINNTTVNSPEPIPGATFKPTFFNLSVAYAYQFGKNIDAGINVTFVNEGVANAKANAVGLDAGIQYTTGLRDETHFGITLRNVGSNVRFAGDGLTYTSTSIDDQNKFITVSNRSEKFQLPTQLGISGAYDFYLGQKSITSDAEIAIDTAEDGTVTNADAERLLSAKSNTRLTINGSFISNAFINDYLGAGAELAFREKFFIRAGYRYETGITNIEKKVTVFNGVAAGAGVAFNLSKNNRCIIDYSWRPSSLGAVHAFGIRLIN